MMKKKNSFKDISWVLILVILILISHAVMEYKNVSNEKLIIADIISFLLISYTLVRHWMRNRERADYIEILKDTKVTAANEVLNGFPLAMAVFDIDGAVLWYNDEFQRITDNNNLYLTKINAIFTEIKWMDILQSDENINLETCYNGRYYNVFGKVAKGKGDEREEIYSIILYFEDITEQLTIRKMYENERTDVIMVNIDNYDEIFQKMDDSQSQEVISKINSIIVHWGIENNAITKKLENDRYIMFFEHENMIKSAKDKFNVVDKVRKIGEEIKMPVTISIGIGTGGHILENENHAKAAMEMVLGRGGDQAAVKDSDQYTFYGGKAKDYEKSTRVKTRAFSVALRDYIVNSDCVIFMGHSNADYDCFGAALGLQRAARNLAKKPYIVYDNSYGVKNIVKEISKNQEYDGMLISPEEALDIVTEETLVVILDTHRANMLPCPELLNIVNKIIVIDHHRRSTDFISPVSLTYHEPYASSTCEMVTEILQHIGDVRKVSALESQALYMGILMDTKNFVVKTGIRTFEAASYLKRCGLNTIEIRKLFNVEHEEYIHRLDIIKNAEIFEAGMAISVCNESYVNMRVLSAQAADEMMNIADVKAAFVIYPVDSVINISARSYGEVNVQLVMEKLGGGGHATVAGAQIRGVNPVEAENMLKKAILEYSEEVNV